MGENYCPLVSIGRHKYGFNELSLDIAWFIRQIGSKQLVNARVATAVRTPGDVIYIRSACGHRISRAGARLAPLIPPNRYFLKLRICAISALMSASVTFSAGFIRTLPSLSLSPSLRALAASSSVNPDWTLASV